MPPLVLFFSDAGGMGGGRQIGGALNTGEIEVPPPRCSEVPYSFDVTLNY